MAPPPMMLAFLATRRRRKLATFSCLCWSHDPCPANQQLCPLRRKLHQQFELYKDQVKKLGEESQVSQTARAEPPTCGVCHKTKFADGCGRACCYCQSRFCARCGGRVPLRANKVSACALTLVILVFNGTAEQLIGCCLRVYVALKLTQSMNPSANEEAHPVIM